MNAKDLNFAYQVKHALDQSLDDFPSATAGRLAAARKLALARKKPEPLLQRVNRLALAGGFGGQLQQPLSRLGWLGIAAPLVAGTMLFIGLYQFEREQHLAEQVEIDLAVLSDNLPVSAYVDRGFKAYLTRRDE